MNFLFYLFFVALFATVCYLSRCDWMYDKEADRDKCKWQ